MVEGKKLEKIQLSTRRMFCIRLEKKRLETRSARKFSAHPSMQLGGAMHNIQRSSRGQLGHRDR